MKLVIVESPTKARKLASFLGSAYQVEASVGHVRDLPKKKLGVDIEHNFEPEYEVSADKTKVIKRLRELAAKTDTIYLATDPDREGEAIAWHVKYLLEHDGDKKTDKKFTFLRATFHEITKSAVEAALHSPETLRMDLVNAQQARRVLDRLVGYKISPVLWKKVRRGLSAGRVQSVALRMIVEREREIAAFKPEEYWEVSVGLSGDLQAHLSGKIFQDGKVLEQLPAGAFVAEVVEFATINAEMTKFEPHAQQDVQPVIEALPTASYEVSAIDRKERQRKAYPPFSTSTLQQSAANVLGFTSKQTMTVAQQLYEEGLITYHRTDSFNLSTQSIEMARSFIGSAYGALYLPAQPNLYASKSKNAQEAHEAIRITDISKTEITTVKLTTNHQKLYDLIWRRFVASQMQPAVYDQTAVSILAQDATSKSRVGLRATGSILKFEGWMKLFPGQGDSLLPELQSKQVLAFGDMNAAQKFTQPPALFNDASLVKELEKKGIGRPSTYASIISVIVDRGYVERQEKRYFATSIGMVVNDFLMEHFKEIMDYDFTAVMEDDLDSIARGDKEWQKIVADFYTPLAKKIDLTVEKADRMDIPVEKTGEMCPDCSIGEIVIRAGKFGKFKSCSRFPECKYTKNIVETVDGALCPLCQQGGVVVKPSRWGKSFFGCSRWPECDWASWKKPEPGEKITKEDWAIQQAARAERKAAKAAERGDSAGKSTVKSAGKSAAPKVSPKKKAAKKSTQKASSKTTVKTATKTAAKTTTPKKKVAQKTAKKNEKKQ